MSENTEQRILDEFSVKDAISVEESNADEAPTSRQLEDGTPGLEEQILHREA